MANTPQLQFLKGLLLCVIIAASRLLHPFLLKFMPNSHPHSMER